MPLLLEWGKKWKLSCGCVYLINIIIIAISIRIVFVVVTV